MSKHSLIVNSVVMTEQVSIKTNICLNELFAACAGASAGPGGGEGGEGGGLFKAYAVNEEDPERERATQEEEEGVYSS